MHMKMSGSAKPAHQSIHSLGFFAARASIEQHRASFTKQSRQHIVLEVTVHSLLPVISDTPAYGHVRDAGLQRRRYIGLCIRDVEDFFEPLRGKARKRHL